VVLQGRGSEIAGGEQLQEFTVFDTSASGVAAAELGGSRSQLKWSETSERMTARPIKSSYIREGDSMSDP
jgi:hypothetical protein